MIYTKGGRRWNHWSEVKPDDITREDVCWGLSHMTVAEYNGATAIPWFEANRSLLLLDLAKQFGMSNNQAIACAFRNAPNVYGLGTVDMTYDSVAVCNMVYSALALQARWESGGILIYEKCLQIELAELVDCSAPVLSCRGDHPQKCFSLLMQLLAGR